MSLHNGYGWYIEIASYVITQRLVNADYNILHCKAALHHMSLQSGIASYVIAKRLVNADYIIRPAISTKRNSSLNIKKNTTKYAA
jgi:hypothetical protein